MRNKIHNNKGFTLLELLLSMVILGIIITIIMGGFRLGLRAWEKGEKRAEFNQKIRIVLDHLMEEIRSAHSLYLKNEKESDEETEVKVHAFWGEQNQIKFITTAPGLNSHPEMTITRAVTYYLSSGNGLAMREVPCLGGDCFGELEKQEEVILDPNITELSFRYAYIAEPKEGEEADDTPAVEWLTSWDPADKEEIKFKKEEQVPGEILEPEGPNMQKLPSAVEITISMEFAEENRSRQLPPFIIPIYLGKEVNAPK